jgi:hypothetical protein
MGTRWEPSAALTCTPLVATPAGFGVLQKPCDIFEKPEIGLQKSRAGLLPRPGTLSSSSLFFLVGLLPHMSTPSAAPARRTTRPSASAG